MSDKKKVIKKEEVKPVVKSGLVQMKQEESLRAVKARMSAQRTVKRQTVKAIAKRVEQILVNCRRGKVNPWDDKYLALYEAEIASKKK
jgi:hypothetical protein